MSSVDRRDSHAEVPSLITDPDEKARREVDNGFDQYDLAVRMVETFLEGRPFRLRPSLIQSLQREALKGLSAYAGNWRPGPVSISKSKHTPPDAHLVAELVEDMCEYVNSHWETSSAAHLSAYVMWRLNWIHPFDDGNGRTSRMVSYLVLAARSGYLPPGSPTIPEMIADDRRAYFEAIDAADEAWRQDRLDVSRMEDVIEGLLAKQLLSYHRKVRGTEPA